MSQSIKLTEKNIFICLLDAVNTYQMQIFLDEFPQKKIRLEQARDQILENQEKAEKYDDLMNANAEIVKSNISNTEIFQENKSLKEEIKENQAIVEKSNKYQSQLSALHAKSELSYFEMLQVIDRLQKLLDSKIEIKDFGTIRKFITINEIETVLKIDSECKGATS